METLRLLPLVRRVAWCARRRRRHCCSMTSLRWSSSRALRERLSECAVQRRARSNAAGNGGDRHESSRCRVTDWLEDALIAGLSAVRAHTIRSAVTATANLWFTELDKKKKKGPKCRKALVNVLRLTYLSSATVAARYRGSLPGGCLGRRRRSTAVLIRTISVRRTRRWSIGVVVMFRWRWRRIRRASALSVVIPRFHAISLVRRWLHRRQLEGPSRRRRRMPICAGRRRSIVTLCARIRRAGRRISAIGWMRILNRRQRYMC